MAYVATTFVFGETPSASKWNQLTGNDAYFDSLIGAGTAWTSFTPSYTNLTVGNGTNQGSYLQIGKKVTVKTKFILGTTSSVGTQPILTLPVTAVATGLTVGSSSLGVSNVLDAGTNNYPGEVNYNSTTQVYPLIFNAGGTYAVAAALSATVPITFGTSDEIDMYFSYESA